MSMAIQRSKYTGDRMNYQGDPGLFDFLKKTAQVGLGLAGMLPGVGGIARGISGAIFPPAPGTTTYSQMPSISRMPQVPTGMPGSGIPQGRHEVARTASCPPGFGKIAWSANTAMCTPPLRIGPITIPTTGQLPFLGVQPGPDPNGAMPGDGAMLAGRPAVSGYHWNKSGYFLKSGEYVSAGTKMVKNRRRNPANPRATSNAITRIKGAKRYAKSLSAISIRKKC